jgi:hypothetical protein
MKRDRRLHRTFVCEQLEPRCLLSGFQTVDSGDFHAMMVAGDPKGRPADSPALRVDANTTSSPFAGVGSLQITASSGTYICTGTAIDATHVLTAGHCVDIDNNGKPDVTAITFNLNYGGDLTSKIPASGWVAHPDFTGFNNPAINDDLAVITLAGPLPSGVPIYPLATSDMSAGKTHLYLVGYGQSGDGVKGYTTGASFTVKRDGENMVDAFFRQDDAGRTAANEVFRFDFDGPKANTNTWGGRTLGNDRETTLGGGDSGGPSFVLINNVYYLAGVNTFTQGVTAPRFGSLGGGINLFPYTAWIRSAIAGTSGTSAAAGSGINGAGNTGSALIKVLGDAVDFLFPSSSRDFTLGSSTAQQSSSAESISLTGDSHVTSNSTAAPTVVQATKSAPNEPVERTLSAWASVGGNRKFEISHDDRLKTIDEIFHSDTLDEILEESILTAEV